MIGNGISPLKYRSVGPVSVLQPWYDSLSVKPSAGLWADLKTMADGMNTDGDWSKFDFFSMLAALETDEQRLRPLKTTSGLDITSVNSPTLNVNGVQGNGTSSYLNLNWNPLTNIVQSSQDNMAHIFYVSQVGTASNRYYFGAPRTILRQSNVAGTNNVIAVSNGAGVAFNTISALGFKSVYRNDAANVNLFDNSGTVTTIAEISAAQFVNNIYLLAANSSTDVASLFSNSIQRMFITGSASINYANVKSRLNTFFAARGLTTF